ncbi:MAG TPA: DUF366 domain-containing protein [Deltaproteobacteria bacterium]|nr:MAG: hypothetical protein A2048_09995 [Deltaproteobacteria bacterium GWA2_45_12]HBF12164.1 DUF366 domain-containing protein [Deltaproteobacteria bacterium]
MKTFFIEKETAYDGTQLHSHWVLNQTGIYGDVIAAFIGPARVDLEHMVDLEDVLAKKPIFSHKMLHFIAEHFDDDLEKMILRQRLFISCLQTDLLECLPEEKIIRRGDDLFSEYFKLTVSIATKSSVSTLMHTAINIDSHDTPVPTKGLDDFKLNAQAMARSVMNRYVEELEGVARARAKVKGVF